ncbi:MAG TPA: hypothetical protein VGE50_08050 [Gammaproteobacteria bacterium]
MQNRFFRGALLVLLSLVSSQVFGEAGWTSYAYVAELTSTNQFQYLVTLKVAENPSGCRSKSVFYQDHSAYGSEQMFQLLLEALSRGKRVRVYVTGNCELNGYSEISSVSIIP